MRTSAKGRIAARREPNLLVAPMQARVAALWPLRHDGRRTELRFLVDALQRIAA
jgi:hypothetical protein